VFELDRFVYSASHDLSAPLKSILGLVSVIKLEKEPMKVYGYIDYIKETVLKLESVIKSMVDYARNSHVAVQSEKFNLHVLVKEVIDEFAFLPEATKLNYINLIREDLQILSDRARIKVVLHNLIGNSIKYVDKSKEERWIRITCERSGRYWAIQITDNGIGIRGEYLDKVFNMYFRATELSKGSGLGLFIVKEALNKIGGTIKVQSVFGIETTFEFRIPETDGN
jgi:signal transduction histidine kinase